MEKVVFKVTNFSASPLSLVGLHSLEIPGSCKDVEFSFPEAIANGMIKRLKRYPHIKVTKVVTDKNVKAATAQADVKEAAAATEATKAAATGAKSTSKASSKE